MDLKLFLASSLFVASLGASAQSYPLGNYTELSDGILANSASWAAVESGIHFSWTSKDQHYVKTAVPSIKMKSDTVAYAWRGERVGVEAIVFSKTTTEKMRVRLTEWTKDGKTIPASAGQARFVNYVLTDSKTSCGGNDMSSPKYLVPDVIDVDSSKAITAKTARPVWCTLEVPRDAEAGEYQIGLELTNANGDVVIDKLNLRLVVRDMTLPIPSEQDFHLDFWIQPYSVSRYYKVEKWSQAHFDAMRPYMKMLARAGQNVATAILFYEPWGDQSHDKFDPMIETTKKTDGSWAYDYSIFDRWINYLDSCGINKQINCFSMVPWDMSFRYKNEATGAYEYLKTTTSSAEYKEIWTSFLTSFAAHLREKGWFDKTCIAMDERGLSNMIDAYNVLKACEPDFKMSLAGNLHNELVDKLYDYCLSYGQMFTDEQLASRKAKGYISTYYTCCSSVRPNTMTNNQPAENTFTPLYSVANGLGGYLRWSFMNWPEDPLRDSRYRLFSPGDTYIVYPGNRSSIRYERFIEGVHASEKVRILKEKWNAEANAEAIAKLDAALENVKYAKITNNVPASQTINYLESILNDSPAPVMEPPTDYCMPDITNEANSVQRRWLKTAKTTGCTTNLNFSATSGSTNGYVMAPTTIQVKRGTTFKLTVVPTTDDDGMQYCRVGLFADWNNDTIFDTSNKEKVAMVGSANTANTALLNQTFTITVPSDAKEGVTRLRLCYNDAWNELPDPCGELRKGFVFDIPMNIIPDVPIGISSASNVVSYKWKGSTLKLSRPSQISVYNTSGQLLDQTQMEVAQYSTKDFTPGTYVIHVATDEGKPISLKFLQK